MRSRLARALLEREFRRVEDRVGVGRRVESARHDFIVWNAAVGMSGTGARFDPDRSALEWVLRRTLEKCQVLLGSRHGFGRLTLDDLVAATWMMVVDDMRASAERTSTAYDPLVKSLSDWLGIRANQAWARLAEKMIDDAGHRASGLDFEEGFDREQRGVDHVNTWAVADTSQSPEATVLGYLDRAEIAAMFEGRTLGPAREWVDRGVISEQEAAALVSAAALAADNESLLDAHRLSAAWFGRPDGPVGKRLNAVRTRLWIMRMCDGLDEAGLEEALDRLQVDGWLESPHGGCVGQLPLVGTDCGWFSSAESRRGFLAVGKDTYGVTARLYDALSNVLAGLMLGGSTLGLARGAVAGNPEAAAWLVAQDRESWDEGLRGLEPKDARDVLAFLRVVPHRGENDPASRVSGVPPTCGHAGVTGVRDVGRLSRLRAELPALAAAARRLAAEADDRVERAVTVLAAISDEKALRDSLVRRHKSDPWLLPSDVAGRWLYAGRKSLAALKRLLIAAHAKQPAFALAEALRWDGRLGSDGVALVELVVSLETEAGR